MSYSEIASPNRLVLPELTQRVDLVDAATNPKSSTVGRLAFMSQLKALGYAPSDKLIVKLGNTRAFEAQIHEDFLDFTLTSTRFKRDEQGKKIYEENKALRENTKSYEGGFGMLSWFSQKAHQEGKPSGVFLIPNQTRGLAATDLQRLNAVFFEIDGATLEHQAEVIAYLEKTFGLVPSVVVYSGGKSLHCYYTLTEGATVEQWKELQYSLITLTGGDAAIVSPNRVMRAAGFFRHDKENWQTLCMATDWVYSPEDIKNALSSRLPNGMSYRRFKTFLEEKSEEVFTRPEEEMIIQSVDLRVDPLTVQEQHELEGRGGIPLIYLLPQKDRQLIREGSKTGDRRSDQYRLVLNICTTVKWCIEHNVRFSGKPYELALSHAENCPDNEAVLVELERQWREMFIEGRKIAGKQPPVPSHELLARVDNFLNDQKAEDPETFETKLAKLHHELTSVEPYVTTRINQRFIDKKSFLDLPEGHHFFKTPTGTGKTTAAKELVMLTQAGNVVSYRNSLCRQFCKDTGATFVWGTGTDDLDTLKTNWVNPETWTASSVESILKFPLKEYLVIEEASKVIETLMSSSTCAKDRRVLLSKFIEMVRCARVVIYLDADIRGVDVEYIKGIDGDRPVYLTLNEYQFSESWKCIFHTLEESTNSKNPIEQLIYDCAEAGEKLLVVSDSKRELRKLSLRVDRELGITDDKKLLVDSEAMLEKDPRVIEFLESPKDYIESNRPDVVFMSPTCEASVSIDVHGYFDKVIGVFSGVVHHLSARQMLARLRDNLVPRHIFCVEKGRPREGCKSCLPSVVKASKFETLELTVTALANVGFLDQVHTPEFIQRVVDSLSYNSLKWTNPTVAAWANYKAMTNYSLANLRECLKQALEDFGHTVIHQVTEEKTEMSLKPETDYLNNLEAARISQADDVSLDQATSDRGKPNAGLDEEYRYKKALLAHRVPGVDLTPEFVLENHVTRPDLIPSLERRVMIAMADGVKTKEMKKVIHRINHGEVIDFKSVVPLLELADKLNLRGLIAELLKGETWHSETDWIKAILKLAVRNKKLIKAAFNISVHSKYDPCVLLARILGKFGYKTVGKRERDGAGLRRVYHLQDDDSPDVLTIVESITQRMTGEIEKITQDNHRVDGVELAIGWVEKIQVAAGELVEA